MTIMMVKSLVVATLLTQFCIIHAFVCPIVDNFSVFRLKSHAEPSSTTVVVEEEQPHTSRHKFPNRASYSAALHANIRCGDLRRAEEVLESMEEPLTCDYNLLLTAYAREGEAQKAERLLKSMVDRCRCKEQELGFYQETFCPDLISYNLVLESHAKSGKLGAGERAMDILNELNHQCDEGDLSFRPNQRTYSAVMQAVIRCDDSKDKAVDIVKQLIEESKARGVRTETFLQRMVQSAYASSSDPDAAEKAEALLEDFEREGTADLISCNTCLKAWKSSTSADAPKRAEKILRRMEKRQCVDTVSYTTMIGILAKKGDKASAHRAQEILTNMQESYSNGNESIKPNSKTYNSVLLALVRCGNIQSAEQLLGQMEGLLEEGQSDSGPTVVSYSTVMSGWAKSGAKDSLGRTEAIFDRMVALYESGHEAARPYLFSYVILINTYGRCCRKDPSLSQKAENTLFDMYQKYKAGNKDLKPNIQLITTVIDCWQKSGRRDAGERAEALLDWTLNLYNEKQDEAIRPNEFTFAAAISAWGRSRAFGKSVRARNILTRMINLHESGQLITCPNTHCYTAVINSCAYCENDVSEKREALRIAIATYKDLVQSKYGSPNQVTYSTLLTGLRNLLPEGKERSSAVQTVFKQAREDGRVDNLVVRRLQSALTKDELQNVYSSSGVVSKENGRIGIKQIPKEWCRNVAFQRRP